MPRLDHHISIRVNSGELQSIEEVRRQLEEEAGPGAYVTQREALLYGLTIARKYRSKLAADKGRKR